MENRPLIFVVISILIVALVCSPTVTSYVFAAYPAHSKMGTGKCDYSAIKPGVFQVTCCWIDSRGSTSKFVPVTRTCQTCGELRNQPGSYFGCTQPEIQFMTAGGVLGLNGTVPSGGTFETQGNLPNTTNVPKGGIFQSQPTPPKSTVPSGGTFEEQQIPPSGPAIPGGGTFESGGTFNSLQPAQEGASGASPPVDEAAPPVDEDTQPPTLTKEGPPVCPEGQVLVEESGLCVLEDCPEGQVLDEEAGLCVLEEPEVAEDEPEQVEIDEPEQQSSEGDGSQR
jgi:hypothetical protein